MTADKVFTPRSPKALFRYLVVSQVLSLMHQGYSRSRAVREVAGRPQSTPEGTYRTVSERTLHRWVKAFFDCGGGGLEPRSRSRAHTSALPEGLVDYCAAQKTVDPRVSIPELIKRARRRGIIREQQKVSRSTLYRALKHAGVSVKRCRRHRHDDKRRFAYEHRMQMVLCDGKHFRVGVHRRKRVALFFLDDATRYGLEVVVGTAETARLFLRGLHEVIRRSGLPSLLYVDHGPGFIARDTVQVVHNLGIALVHGSVSYPQGHGKIERFHQTAFQAVLRNLDGRPDVDADPMAVRLRLRHWLVNAYNRTGHESLSGECPGDRFVNDTKPLRFPESEQVLDSQFLISHARTVSPDNVISLNSTSYELPTGSDGKRITVYRNVLSDTIHMIHKGRFIKLHPVDPAFNARTRRGFRDRREDPEHPLPESAADHAYARDFKPIVGSDGGFLKPTPPSQEDEK